MSEPRLLLASQSPRRRELLTLLGIPFEVATPNVVEIPQSGEPPAALVARLSRAKAEAAADGRHPCSERDRSPSNDARRSTPAKTVWAVIPGIIVACDTVVALDDEVLGKPTEGADGSQSVHGFRSATSMLHRLRGRSHFVYSAVTLLETTTGRTMADVAETRVAMRTYTDAEIAAYVASGDPLDKAGAYAIQHAGFHPVAELRGCYANVMGLPLCHLTRCLRAWGVAPSGDVPAACQAYTGHCCPVYEMILCDL
jgi:septum formation protein